MRRPPLREAGAEAQQQLSEAKFSASHSSLQPAPLDRLCRLYRLQHYLNCWLAKVIPDEDVLTDAYRRDRAQAQVQARIEAMLEEMQDPGQDVEIPDDLRERVERHLRESPATSWDEAIRKIAMDDEEGAT